MEPWAIPYIEYLAELSGFGDTIRPGSKVEIRRHDRLNDGIDEGRHVIRHIMRVGGHYVVQASPIGHPLSQKTCQMLVSVVDRPDWMTRTFKLIKRSDVSARIA
jgi:hypothetical protein